MKPANHSSSAANTEKLSQPQTLRQLKQLPPKPDEGKLTRGQRIADAMATKVGSWTFLIGQSVVLAGWVGTNLMPGVPHWDEQPFILLNLVFSFASAYTAPIVLMSQNRQSDTDRKNAEHDREVNMKTMHDLELLHEKLDELRATQLQELVQILKQQQQSREEIKLTVAPEKAPQPVSSEKSVNSPAPSVLLPTVFGAMVEPNVLPQSEFGDLFSNNQLFNQNQATWDNTKLLIRPYVNESKPNA
ncbi:MULTISPECIES: DUF1003 domain-containing protein [Aerosakkonema]|uniref:DUF1003 domain-containing protein n=1 Tax=Aerosakkonema TaxID=1246629 RepID=UPI0035B9DBD5